MTPRPFLFRPPYAAGIANGPGMIALALVPALRGVTSPRVGGICFQERLRLEGAIQLSRSGLLLALYHRMPRARR